MFGLGLLKGLSVTMRHFIQSYVYDRKPWEPRYSEEWLDKHQAIDGKGLFTIQYPEQRRKITENFRFHPMLIYEESPEKPRCTACGICARVCPTQCIWIERMVDDRGRPKAQPAGFWIDTTICMSCGFCAEFCPFDAIKMNQEHELFTPSRDRDMFFDMNRLLVSVDYYAKLHPTDYAAEEAARQAKEEAKQQAKETRKVAAAKKRATKPAAGPRPEEPAAAPQATGEQDDLERIEGVGPKIAGILRDAGFSTFAQLADADAESLERILAEADSKLANLADTATWPRQAKLAASGKWDALEKWQERLRGGRQA